MQLLMSSPSWPHAAAACRARRRVQTCRGGSPAPERCHSQRAAHTSLAAGVGARKSACECTSAHMLRCEERLPVARFKSAMEARWPCESSADPFKQCQSVGSAQSLFTAVPKQSQQCGAVHSSAEPFAALELFSTPFAETACAHL